jgi:hypothetical protein
MNDFSGARSFWQRSMICSSSVTSPSPILNMPAYFRVGRRGQLAAHVEELVLDLAQRGVEPDVFLLPGTAALHALGVEDAHEADDGVQLVHGAVGHDAGRVLRDALAANQAGLAAIAERV